MTFPTSQATNHPRRVPRWLPVLAIVAVAGVLIVLLSILLRRFGPQPEVWLRIAPAAATVDEATAIALSSGGWRRSEQVAICLNEPGDEACDAESALRVEAADPDGALQTSVLAGAQLAEGHTTFLARGLESGRQTSRAFRVLRAPDGPGAARPIAPNAAADLTPILGGQPADLTSPAAGGLGAGEVATPVTAADQFPDWRGEYFTNPDLIGEPALVRNDPDPNLDWGEGSPAPGVIPTDGFSARWSRSLNFAPGIYRFMLTAEEGGRLVVEGQPVIDAWRGVAGQTMTADQALSGGQYQVVVHFRNVSGPARIVIGWSPLPTPTPILVAGVDPAPTSLPTPAPTETPGGPPTATPTETPGGPPTATPTDGPPNVTLTPETSTPGATETVVPSSSVTASATETSVTPNGAVTPGTTPGTPTAMPGTPTATPDTPTMTPTPVTTGTPLTPPGSVWRFIEINPSVGLPGQEITVNSGNWSPGTVVRVSLGQFNTSYTQAERLDDVSFTTPIDSSQAWSFRFIYPNEPPWSNPTLPVYVWVHNANWSEWGRDEFDIDRP